MAPEAVTLEDPPTDGITALSYLVDQPTSENLLASSSWDGCLRIHDTSTRQRLVEQGMESGPLLSLATPGGGRSMVYTGGLDGFVRSFDITSSALCKSGDHGGEVSCLCPVDSLSGDEYALVASAGWNSKFKVWDSRSPQIPVCDLDLPGKAYGMDCVGGKCVVATSGRRTCTIDLRMSGQEEEEEEGEELSQSATFEADLSQRESSLKYQTRCVRLFPDGTGVALGSIEGRVAIEFLNSVQNKKYAFKCHRVGDTVYPVNAIDFHPVHGTFATGGCDGSVVVWDAYHKKRLHALGSYATSIAALAFNATGSELAIASSYTFEDGERDHPRDEIYIRPILDHEAKPKSKG